MRLGLEAGAQTLDIAAEQGVRGVPISAEQLVTAGVEATLAPLRERGLEVCQIGAFGYNPLSTDRGRQAREAATLARAIPVARETGCPYIVICGGNYHPSGFGASDPRTFQPQALDEVARALAPMAAMAEQHGAKLAIEPYLKTVVSTPERFLALQEKVESDALCVNIDVTSLYSGFWDLLDPRRTVEHICTALAGHYGLGHVKEIALAEGFHLHAGLAPLGQGATDWAQVLRLVEPHLPADSWLILEHVATPEEARASLSYLRTTAAQAGVTLT
jgi:sugar phosphate isomerase/epimerase